ncbi:sensor histidine kinase [Actinocorallia sp. A-T 12471]|uniref:sensor histidine kinase n=1 Tax=Actinocorallia sp. A-T 12471 TaxID=3089813 RepID=UPI0029D19702|nr:sensor histidine kinase [Actinocorallia sp. A-T 12471]MDX6744289.1 sensor histidine kinase [Actinocorallia sp. A-T 12471]
MTTPIRDLRARAARHPEALDALVALVLAALTLADVSGGGGSSYAAPGPLAYAVLVAVTGAVALRQRFPVGVLAVVLAGEVYLGAAGQKPSGDIVALLIAVYTVAAHRPLARSVLAGTLAFAVSAALLATATPGVHAVSLTLYLALLATVWWVGRSTRLRRSYLAELEDRAARLEKARFADARAARVEERSRIARELHDVVAHHVSVMTVQAGAARRIIDRDPDLARESIATIEQVGRTALSEMRRIVGVLRTDRDAVAPGSELSPQPGVEDLSGLIEQVRETGLAVELDVAGRERRLSTGVDLAAYRLIQEALTNSLKHAGPHARAWVRLDYGDRSLVVEICDDGRGVIDASAGGSGHGLVGMRERVALYGGELRIGPRTGGGFRVRATFPLEA